MKGIAISTVAYILIAVVSISALIIYVGLQLSPTVRKAYCSFIVGLNSFLPLPESFRPSIPKFCENLPGVQTEIIETGDVNFISEKIAAYTLACWYTTGKVNLKNDKICYEIILKRVDGIITSENVTNYLPQEYKNIISWKIGDIKQPKSVGIFYNSTSRKIEVV